MKNNLIVVFTLSLFLYSCNASTSYEIQTAAASTIESNLTASAPTAIPPTQAPPTLEPTPTQSFASVCASAPTCEAPAVKDTDVVNSYCVKKIPYQNVSIPVGSTFSTEGNPADFTCSDSGAVVKGMKIITCTGARLYTYNLKVTNTACTALTLTIDSAKCQDGLGFDSAQSCCAELSAQGASSTVKVNIGTCK